MSQLLKDKVGVVTGSGGGIGRAIAVAFAREGAKVVVTDFNEETGNQTVELIRAAGGDAQFFAADVSDEAKVAELMAFTTAQYGRLDIACNSAAVSRGSGPIHTFDKAVFDQTLELCLTNTWLCMKYQIPLMLEQGGGSIVNTASMYGVVTAPERAAYCAAKAGVVALTKVLAIEWADRNIRVNAIAPGIFGTPMVKGLPEDVQEALAAGIPNPSRLGAPEEFASLVAHIIDNDFLNGEVIRLDGATRLTPR